MPRTRPRNSCPVLGLAAANSPATSGGPRTAALTGLPISQPSRPTNGFLSARPNRVERPAAGMMTATFGMTLPHRSAGGYARRCALRCSIAAASQATASRHRIQNRLLLLHQPFDLGGKVGGSPSRSSQPSG